MIKFFNMCFRTGRLATVVLAVLLSLPGSAAAEDLSAGSLFKLVEGRFTGLGSISYTVKRTIVSRRQRTEDRWMFRYRNPAFLRVDYLLPHERVIILDEKTLTEYIPELKKAKKTDLSTMTAEKKEQTIGAVMGRVSVEGMRLGNYEEMQKRAVQVRAVTWAGMDAYLVEGKDPRYLVYIDTSKKVLLRTEIYDKKGGLVIRTEASRFVEAARGFWLPQEIRTAYGTADGFVQSTVVLQDIKVNEGMPDDAFRPAFPKGVEIIPN